MLAYAIKSAIYLSIMYIPYMLMLRNESFFRFNRLLLLGIMLLSLILPFCDLHSLAIEANPIRHGIIEIGMPIAIIEEAQTSHHVSTGINWQLVITYIYISGVIVTAMVKLYQLAMLYLTMRKGVLWKDENGGVTIYCHANNIVAFSWFNTIVINEQDYTQNAKEIIGHEMGHIHHHHSWDICLVNIIEVIQWMNPLAWILASSLRDVHEYEADDAVLRSGVNARQYQTLLIRKAVGSSSYTFANSFNHSQLKKRFTMMFRKESNPWMRTKGLYIIPVAVIALSAFATPELNNRVDAITDSASVVSVDKGTKKSADGKEKTSFVAQKDTISTFTATYSKSSNITDEGDNKVFDQPEVLPQYPGGMKELAYYLTNNVRYPKDAFDAGLSGRVLVMFIVEKDGSLSGVEAIKFTRTDVDSSPKSDDVTEDQTELATKALKDEAERVIASSPKWAPGMQNGVAVRTKFIIPVTFRLS